MKVKISIDILRPHTLLSILSAMIADNNAGVQTIEMSDIIGVVKCKKSEYPDTYRKTECILDGDSLFIGEGKNFICVLEWKEMHAL